LFKKADESGLPSGEVLLWHPSTNQQDVLRRKFQQAMGGDETDAKLKTPRAQIEAFLAETPEAKARLGECYAEAIPDGQNMKALATDPVVVPIITALAKLGFDSIMDAQARSLDDLKKRSIQTYSTTEFLRSDALRSWSCLGVARITKDRPNQGDSHLGMVALFEIVHFDAKGEEHPGRLPRDIETSLGMRLKPLFVRAVDAIAVTKKGDDKAPELIALSFALALKGIENTPGKLPQTVAFGAGTLSVPKVKIGKTGETIICREKECSSTGLIPFPEAGPLELTLAVTETGNVGFNIDLAKAQLAAFKAAMGPALSSALQTHLKED
jgi:hypothetical protein